MNEVISFGALYDLDYNYPDESRLAKLDRFIDHSREGTPLHAAAGEDHTEMVAYLVSRGANTSAQNLDRLTAAGIVHTNWYGPPDPGFSTAEKRWLRMLKILEYP